MDYNFILSLDRTNFKSHISNFKFLAGVKILLRAKFFLHFF